MAKKNILFYSKKLFILNISLLSMIIGFVLATVINFSCNDPLFPSNANTAYAQDDYNAEQGLKALQDIQYSFRSVAEKALPVVVEINVSEVITQTIPRFDSPWDFFFDQDPNDEGEEREFERPGLGSGVIVNKQGNKVYVVTNNHVVGSADKIIVRLYDGREFSASIIGKDQRTDLALVAFETSDAVPIADLGDSDSLHVGDWAIAIGNPMGFESTVTVGIISALKRKLEQGTRIADFTDYIQTDADINPGNSGGALLNIKGEIIGINTWIASQTGGNMGLGFAIPINNVKKVINDFIERGRVIYGWLGVQIGDNDTNRYPGLPEDLGVKGKKGALLLNVFKNSPAEKGGLLPGDLIINIDNTDIVDSNHLTRIIGNVSPGKQITCRIIRYKQEKTLKVTLEARDEEEKVEVNTDLWPGMLFVGLTEDLRKRLEIPNNIDGVVVTLVTEKAPAGVAGIKSGDVITKINDKLIKNSLDFYRSLNESTTDEIMFRIYREKNEVILGLVK